MTTPVVAFLGTGTMGAAMVRSLRRADIAVRAWNRSRHKAEPLRDSGATVATTPAEAADGADVVVTMLFDADSALAAIREAAPGRGTVWLQTTTVGVEGAQRTIEAAAELGIELVDCPVLGTRKPAEDGALILLASGPERLRDQLSPVLEAVGGRTIWLGEAGQGSQLKLVCNAWVLSLTVALAQSVALAEGLGLDPRAFLDAIAGGPLDTPYARVKAAAMLSGEYPVSFGLPGAFKDAGLIVAALQGAHVPDQFATAVWQLLGAASQRVPDPVGVDMAAVVEALRPRGD